MKIGNDDINLIANSYPGDLSVYEIAEGRLLPLYISAGIPGLSGMSMEEYKQFISDDASRVVFEADRPIVAAEVAKSLPSKADIDLVYRIFHKTWGFVWVHAKSRFIGERKGNPVLLSAFMDTSLETELHEELLDRVGELVHVCDADSCELLYANKAALDIVGDGKAYQGKPCYSFFHGLGKPCSWCGLSQGLLDVHLGEMHDPDRDRYYSYDLQKVLWHGRDAFALFATDITESSKTRKSLLEERGRLESIIEHIPAGICVFGIEDGREELIAANEYLRNLLQTSTVELSQFETAAVVKRVHAEDADIALEASRELMSGKEAVSCDFRIRDIDSAAYRWLHLDGRSVIESGARLVFASVTDATARKLEEERYGRTVGDLLGANPSALCAYELNLTRNTCEEGRGTSEYLQSTLASDTADGLFANIASLIVDEDDLHECLRIFDRKALIESFEKGTDHLSIEYRRRSDENTCIWAKTYISILRNPSTSDLEAVIYSEDIDERKKRSLAMRIVTENGYDYVGIIDAVRRKFAFIDMGAQVPEDYRKQYYTDSIFRDYDATVQQSADSWVHPDELSRFIEESSIDNLVKCLEPSGHYEFVVRGLRDGTTRRKRLQYAYLDDERESIVVWQTDITDAFLKEQQDTERLEIALAAAKQASNAKSTFLSRMSHEIRTPMNAIIGMDTLAAQAIGDDARVSDCIAKIGISSRYLLSLINDILDMSRIESGKMMLKNESFLLRDLIAQVDDLIYTQAESKGLDYECSVAGEVDEAYIGDAMKLKQVLVNVLGNAVKFTNMGRVSLTVQQISRKSDQARLRFTVNDTGIGMTEEEQGRIFDPFEQVDTSTTTTFGGTGLGLAITKSLVELMGGSIRVRSILGVGSEFTIELPFGVGESQMTHIKLSCNFEKMHTLVVDDDLIVCEQAVATLKDIGMAGEWVTSGAEAVSKVKAIATKDGRYDFILIDWKMPDMDGIETTRQIRKVVGPDVTIIIISAYDWEAIEADAKAAGANMLISKPLFKTTLVSAFEKACGEVEALVPKSVEYNFAGRRVLMAEDNSINVEIAKALLESKGFEVDVAHNGLEALEMFTQSDEGYYDAILMDIRMPQMDGLQATTSIRHWKKADAKTIPIIAMTANAFDEDVEKSRAAGMNAHLAKPIEPEVMYMTLYNILEGDGAAEQL